MTEEIFEYMDKRPLCPKCGEGLQHYTNPMFYNHQFFCSTCGFRVEVEKAGIIWSVI